MKIQLLCIGRLTESYLRDGCAEFAQRLQRYLPLVIDELKEHKTGKKQDRAQIVRTEGERLLARIPPGAFVIALDERGKALASTQLADLLQRQMVDGTACISLIIGGPYGLSDEVRQRADLTLSLSTLTLTHQMARMLLLEQLYRGCTIIRNEPYHH